MHASAIAAVHRVLARIEWDVPMSVWLITLISSHLPQSLYDTFSDLLAWLHRTAAWQGALYASWHMSHTCRCTDFSADWSADLQALQGLQSLLSPHPRVDWGIHRGGWGGLMIQFDVMSSYRVPGGTFLLVPCTNQMIVSRTIGVVDKTTFPCCLVRYSERRL